MKRFLSSFLSFLIVCSCIICCPQIEVNAIDETQSQKNIVAWADYYYNITWTAQKDVAGWRNNNKYKYHKGNSYRLPYGQPASYGRYIGYGVTIDDFMEATQDSKSVFYTTKSYWERNPGSYSVYYAMDCSAFVSLCWEDEKKTTDTIRDISTSIGAVNSSNVNKIEIGDALNLKGEHVVLVTDVIYSGNNVTSIEITEQTPPQLKRTVYSASDLVSEYKGYEIRRYNGTVNPPPNVAPVVSDISIEDGKYNPGTLEVGKSYSINGLISSANKLVYVKVGVYNINGSPANYEITKYPHTKTYDIKKLDSYIKFGRLPVGTYKFRVEATDSIGKTKRLVDNIFRVESKIKIANGKYNPGTLKKGKSYSINGLISSSSNLTYVKVGVYSNNGTNAIFERTATPNAKTYDIKKLDSYIKFGKLLPGVYNFKVEAMNLTDKKFVTLVNNKFTVR